MLMSKVVGRYAALFALFTTLAIASPIFAQCGVERWSVKTGTDADIGLVNVNASTATTITTLRALATPASLPSNNRVQPTETTVFTLNATLTQYKLESDSDYHLVLQDASGNTMIAEIPSPNCVGAGSPFGTGIQSARSQFDAKYTATGSFQTANIPVAIRGVGFFDFLHGQTGVAPNGIEIHPVLNIVFNPTAADFSIGDSPSTLAVTAGSGASTTISTSITGSFNSAISLSASGLPAGATASFSPTSIAAPGSGSSTMTINTTSSTAAGTYAVTITGSGGGTTHTTTLTLTVASGGGGTTSEYVTDGGFESATASGNSAPGWTGTSTGTGVNTITAAGAYPHTGTDYGSLGGAASRTDTLTTTSISIPSTATAASLKFWVNIVTQETTTATAYDTLAVNVVNGSTTTTKLTLSNLNAPSSSNTNGTYFQPAAIDLSAYKGATIQLQFKAVNDSTLPTTFRIDDVSLQVTASGSGDTTAPATSITAPAAGATVSNTVSVTASATDNVGVTKVEFYLDGALKSTSTATPYAWSWNTTTAVNGSHSLVSKAYDAAGNVGTSAAVSVTVSNTTTTTQLLGNPGFENGSTSTAPWTVSSGVVTNSTSQAPHGGTWYAWMDGYGSAHTDSIVQTVAIPSGKTSATLTFYLHVDTAETSTTTAYDTLKVQVRNSSGTVLATLATYSNVNAASGYVQKSFNLNSYIGQTIQVYLVGAEDSTLQTSFVVDDFALNVQ
jgi:hypothetical protein